jgi:hypothetical protein
MIESPIAEVLQHVSAGWQLGRDHGAWTAFRQSADGRHRRYLVERTPALLAAKIIKANSEGK